MPDIIDHTTNVTVYDENGNQVDLAKDSTTQGVIDAIGEESGSTILSKLQDIWDKLTSLFTDGLAKIKLWDGYNVVDIVSESGKPNRLAVETYQASDTQNTVLIKDGDGNSYFAKVDASGRLLVSSQTVAPVDTTPVSVTEYGDVSTTDDSFYIIPNGEVLTITKFIASAEVDSTSGNAIEFYYAPNGDTTGLVVINAIHASGNSFQVDINAEYTGDGTKSILLRRRRLSGGAKEIFGRWEGYY